MTLSGDRLEIGWCACGAFLTLNKSLFYQWAFVSLGHAYYKSGPSAGKNIWGMYRHVLNAP